MPIMEIIVKPLTLLRPKQRKVLIQKKILNNLLKSLSIMKISLKLGMRLRNTKNSHQQLKFQMVTCLTISTGEVLMELISPTHIEIKVTVDHATLFLSPKLLK